MGLDLKVLIAKLLRAPMGLGFLWAYIRGTRGCFDFLSTQLPYAPILLLRSALGFGRFWKLKIQLVLFVCVWARGGGGAGGGGGGGFLYERKSLDTKDQLANA